MMIRVDLHIHSKYSRATSPNMDLKHIAYYAKLKGIDLIGTGDFTHPKWFITLKKKLVREGFYMYNGVHFVPSVEIATMGKHRVHHLIIAEDLDAAYQITELLVKKGVNVKSDGRPMTGMSPPELVDIVHNVSERNLVIPAHVWTPWFGLFGSKSGFDRIEDCYKDMTSKIVALETGLSSDPAMNWMVSSLDQFTLVSNSDAHSPESLGREMNLVEAHDYKSLYNAIVHKRVTTIEVDPAFGKYHFDGHRKCNVRVHPGEGVTLCPVCGKPLTIGVLHRVYDLADREYGFKPAGAQPYYKLIPLKHILSAVLGVGVNTKTVDRAYTDMIRRYGDEYSILLNPPTTGNTKLDNVLKANREGSLNVIPGYDGVFGKLSL